MKLHIVMVEPEIPQNTGNISRTCRIPMLPTLRSLNLSNSVAIVAYEILRQKDFEDLQEVSSYFD